MSEHTLYCGCDDCLEAWVDSHENTKDNEHISHKEHGSKGVL